jgi:putative ABC transport system permease protein
MQSRISWFEIPVSDFERAQRTTIFSAAAILISCLGIYGLMSFIIQSRQKEITIRKVLGASEKSIMILLLVRVLKIVIIAFLVTPPLCIYSVSAWLNGFAYRTSLSPEVFLIALLGFVLVVVIVISGNLIRTTKTSVVENLKSE